ncbi:DUF1636 domain-containing protein [Pseudophaeobacter sp.]|uniref:DUF1636 domain-containing protein n=1 Tax=Pseudophaeobacter sp. TaxID=1971739 RepID=UPI003298AFE8
MAQDTDHSLLICTTCRGASGANRLRAALAARLPYRIALRGVDCMAGCDRPITVGLQGPGKTQYLFGDIETEADIEAIASFARQFLHSTTGWSKASERPEPLFNKTLARLPAFNPEARP